MNTLDKLYDHLGDLEDAKALWQKRHVSYCQQDPTPFDDDIRRLTEQINALEAEDIFFRNPNPEKYRALIRAIKV